MESAIARALVSIGRADARRIPGLRRLVAVPAADLASVVHLAICSLGEVKLSTDYLARYI